MGLPLGQRDRRGRSSGVGVRKVDQGNQGGGGFLLLLGNFGSRAYIREVGGRQMVGGGKNVIIFGIYNIRNGRNCRLKSALI